MANKDLFAPPTKEELKTAQTGLRTNNDLFAPPTPDEIKQTAPSWLDTKLPFDTTPRGFIQGGLDTLPTVGMVAGGAVGAPLAVPSLGTSVVGGGALGAAAGYGLKSAGEKYLLGKEEARPEYYQHLGESAKAGAEGEMLGGIIGKAGEAFQGSGVKNIVPDFNRPGTDQIKAAAGNLGVKPTQGMLTDDYVTRNTENSLAQSPSFPGAWIRKEQRPIQEAIGNASKGAVEDQSAESAVDAGKKMRKGVADNLEKRYEPISSSYDEIEAKTKDVPLNAKGLSRISKNIRGLDEAKFEGSDAHKIANKFADWLEQAENVNDIKTLKTKARQVTQDPNQSIEAKSVASSIMGKLEQAESNSVTRQAVQLAKEAPAFPQEGKQWSGSKTGSRGKVSAQDALAGAESDAKDSAKSLIGKIKDTNQSYKGLIKDAQTFGEGSGLTKANKGMASTLRDIREAKPEEMASALFDTGNLEYSSFVKKNMPEQFELARQQRLAEVAKASQAPSGAIDPKKLTKAMDKLGPEAREMLFGSKNVANLKDVQTLLRATPEMVGPSGTPKGFALKEMLNPVQNINDLGRYGLMKSKPAFPAVGGMLKNYGQPGVAAATSGLLAPQSNGKKKGLLKNGPGLLNQAGDE